jgi:hypothetical protein
MSKKVGRTFEELETLYNGIKPEVIGNAFREYLAEHNHSSSEGFNSRDLTGIRRFMEDLYLYIVYSDTPNNT